MPAAGDVGLVMGVAADRLGRCVGGVHVLWSIGSGWARSATWGSLRAGAPNVAGDRASLSAAIWSDAAVALVAEAAS